MLDETQKLPDDPAELRTAAERLVSLAKTQALRIAKLEHQLAGLRKRSTGSKSCSLGHGPEARAEAASIPKAA